MAFGISQLEDRDWVFKKDVSVLGDFTFGDASTDNLNVDGNMDVAGTANFHGAISGDMTFASGIGITGAGTGSNGILITNPKCTASATTATVEVNIGGTAMYFQVSV